MNEESFVTLVLEVGRTAAKKFVRTWSSEVPREDLVQELALRTLTLFRQGRVRDLPSRRVGRWVSLKARDFFPRVFFRYRRQMGRTGRALPLEEEPFSPGERFSSFDRARVREEVARLPERERTILWWWAEGRRMRDLEKRFQISESRVSQVKREAINLLRKRIR
jgi:DNA-binding CsgD family transcriptional regulator